MTQSDATPDQLLSVKEVADHLNVSVQTVYKLVKIGHLECIQLPASFSVESTRKQKQHMLRFRPEAVTRFLSEHTVNTPPHERTDP